MAEYSKIYARINWENEPSKKTALSAANLNKMDLALNNLDDRVIELNTIKAEQSIVNDLVKEITFEQETGIFKITKQDGSEVTYDTKLEKIAINFEYDSLNQKLIITLEDGTKQEVDMESLVSEYEFFDTETIGFIKQEDGKITANIKNGSVTEEKLQPNYLAAIKQQANIVIINAQKAEENAKISERWAVGREEVPESLEDNSKYYAEQSRNSSEQAKQSEVNAKQSENVANESANLASQSEKNAKISEINTKESEKSAKESEDLAREYMQSALESSEQAKLSESNAKQSEINANTSAERAKKEADRASQYASVIVPTFHVNWDTMELIQENTGKGIEFSLEDGELKFEFVEQGGVSDVN